MSDTVEIWTQPESRQLDMICGWRQWADAGSVSSALPRYLIDQSGAEKIGKINPDGFYLFQIPGTHGLVRPVVHFVDGFPQSLDTQRNEFYYTGDENKGTVIFLGDEPHMDIERYTAALLDTAKKLGVKRIIGCAGVYGELPYDKERMISCIYSQLSMKETLKELAVTFSDYQGGASIGSYMCRRAAEAGLEYASFYAFVPTYDFSSISQLGKTIQIENDYMAWLGIMRRINHLLKTRFDLSDLTQKSKDLIKAVNYRIEQLEETDPELGVRDYLTRLSDEFDEEEFNPLADVWEDELRRLLDDPDSDS